MSRVPQNFTKLRIRASGKCEGCSREVKQEGLNYKKIVTIAVADLSAILFSDVPST
jgi:hypothetical protein